MILQRQKNKGQLALGLAFGFSMILVLFAFVFNTSMNVREKIKLQQTTDFASLVAANAQKEYLNIIREYNLLIEADWFVTLARQQINHCANPLLVSPAPITVPSGTSSIAVSNTISNFMAANQISNANIPSLEDYTSSSTSNVSVDYCDMICDKYNEAVNKKFRNQYAMVRKLKENEIMKIIMNGNQDVFTYALHHFLQPANLPWGLQHRLKSELGEGFTTADVLGAYNNQSLTRDNNNGEWGYDVVSENKDDPLFVPKAEVRPFPIPNFTYYLTYNADQQPTCVSTGARTYPFMGMKSSNVKIVKDSIYETHFFTGVHYMPPDNMFENNKALTKRQINDDNLGKSETRVSNASMFKRKIDMSTRAAAKPFGGAFPQSIATDLISLATSLIGGNGTANAPGEFKESAGKKFKGAKLFGIADEEELDGFEIHRANIEAQVKDEQGSLQEVWKILRKDYLH